MIQIGLNDEKFIRGAVPMTKSEVRAITLSKLQLGKQNSVVDIGAGTGSITVECALNVSGGVVYAIDKNEQAIELIKQNIAHFKLKNVQVVKGLAPLAIPELDSVDRVVIGGSGGQLAAIFKWLSHKLPLGGIVVANCITLENTVKIIENLKLYNYKNIEVVQASIARGKALADLTMMLANNPVYIISGER